jgi:D-amino-acid oxidase
VVGTGVSGLTTALALQEAGFAVEIVTAERASATTSALAAAIWHPFFQGPDSTYLRRAMDTRSRLLELAANPQSGVLVLPLTEYSRADPAPPWWMEQFSPVAVAPAAGGAGAFRVEVPIADTSRYLPWLEGEAMARGIAIADREIDSLAEAAADAALIVSCTGFGASRLASDRTMELVRGVVVRCAAPVEPIGCHIDDSDPRAPTYVIERSTDLVLGGTAQPGLVSTIASAEVIADIRRRCAELVPSTAGLPTLGAAVGFRPARPCIRLERDPEIPNVLHNYGHGGAGFTLSWGCAAEIVSLATTTAGTPQRS